MSVPQFWQTLKPLRRVGKLRGVIEVPAFTAPCGPDEACLQCPLTAATTAIKSATNQKATLDFMSEAFTIAVRFKPAGPSTFVSADVLALVNFANNNQFVITLLYLNSRLRVSVNNGASTFDSDKINIGEWNSLFVTYDGTTLKIYNNGLIQSTTLATAAPLTEYATETLFIAGGLAGCISEYVIWNEAFTQDQINFKTNKISGDNGDSTCIVRFPINEGTGTFLTDVVSGLVLSSVGIGENNWIIDRPPLVYGGSFIVGEFTISTGVSYSFKFPVSKPTSDVNFIPCVRWNDEDDNVIRYQLWDNVTGVVLVQNVAGVYRGQVIPDDAILEIWNIDGAATVDLAEAKDILTSILHIVSDATTVTNVSDLDTAVNFNTALAAPFPLTFVAGELVFNEQQTYQ